MRFNPLAYIRCLFRGHSMVNSKAKPGYWTCRACGVRRKQ